jgi:transglutaminase-like putative cysteine protease
MNRARTASLFAHLALAMAGICLACAESDFLVEMPYVLLVYLGLIGLSYRLSGRWYLGAWGANLLGLTIALSVTVWVMIRLREPDAADWISDVPVAVALVPFLGPLLMALLLVRLFRPQAPNDFLVLQGFGLVQVALGSVLTSGTMFGIFLLCYLVFAICAIAAHHSYRQMIHSAPLNEPTQAKQGMLGWLGFSLRWTLALGILALPLFLLTPRVEGPEWEPFARFGARQRSGKTGFSEVIDLNRTGTIESDDSIVFTVAVTDRTGRLQRGLPADQRWRGIVLDRYENGVWRTELTWPQGAPIARPATGLRVDEVPDALFLEFKVPGKLGGLFLADPARTGSEAGLLPVQNKNLEGLRREAPLFYEAGGTIVAFSQLGRPEYRYVQTISSTASQERYPMKRVRDNYLAKLIRLRFATLQPWTRDLLLRLSLQGGTRLAPLHKALTERTVPDEVLPPMFWEQVARLLCDYLAQSGAYSYSLTSRRESATLDPVEDFLVNVKQGPCERFAAALALMLRSQGIPARVVKGFRGAEMITEGNYQVRQSYAHAWVETVVLAEGEGPISFDWLLLDPTPQHEGATPSATLTAWRQLQQSGEAFWQELIVGYSARQQADLWQELIDPERWLTRGPLLGGIALVLGLLWWVQRRRRHRRATDPGPAALYARLRQLLIARLHLPVETNETPRELAERASEILAQRESINGLSTVPRDVVALFYESRFGGQTPGEAQLAEATRRVEALEVALRA